MLLKSFSITNLGPFDEIEFQFDENVNVFTGPNNSGKSTALMALGEIAVYPFALPTKLLRSRTARFAVEFGSKGEVFEGRFPIDLMVQDQLDGCVKLMSTIGYSSFVPAIRRSTDYRAEVPTIAKRPGEDDFDNKELIKRERLIETEASSIDEAAIVQKVIELDYRSYRTGSRAIRKIVDQSVALASQITEGFPISFANVAEDDEGLFPQFTTPDGVVPLNVLSQGTQSLVQWIAHLVIGFAEYYDFPPDLEDRTGVLIVDEIDAHLHPSWQRRIIPALTENFANLQIFCSTHSPLMLAGLKTGQAQLLRRGENGEIAVSKNGSDIVGWSADEILRSFLGVASPTDLQTTHQISRLQELREQGELTDAETEELEELRRSIHSDLIGGPLAAELNELRTILDEAVSGHEPDQGD